MDRAKALIRRHPRLLLAILGGITFALTSPPTDIYPAVVVGLALLAVAIEDAPTMWRAFGRGAAWGTSAGIVGLRFVPPVIQRFTPLGVALSILALVLLAAAQSLIWAIGSAVAHLAHRRAHAPFELSFAVGVMAALSLPTVFLWTPAGLVSPWPVLVQLADLIGERGVSVIFAIAAALLARAGMAAWRLRAERPWRDRAVLVPAGAAVGIFVLLAAHGAWRMSSIAASSADLPTVRVALVDQAVGPHERWEPKNHPEILKKLLELTRKAEADGAELTVWPEAAYPYPLEHGVKRMPSGPNGIVGRGVRGPLLIGLITRDKPVEVEPGRVERNSFNSATLVKRDGSMPPSYDKMQLLWFGEMVPLGAQLPWLRRIFQKSGGLIPGTEVRGLELGRGTEPSLRMGVLNCYEDTLPWIGRLLSRSLAPNLLVNVTNDAWFFGTAEPELHARLGAMRAIENRRDLVRAVNMGVASWIDARGSVRARYDAVDPTVLMVTPSLRDGALTLYARVGDLPLALLLLAALGAFFGRARRAATSLRGPSEP